MNEKMKRKITRELVAKAYDRELTQALSALAEQFDCWRANKIDAFELNEKIHKYHNGISRDLWNRYNLKPEMLLPFVIAEGVIKEEEVPPELLQDIMTCVEVLREKKK